MDGLVEIAAEVIARSHSTAEIAEAWIRSDPANFESLTLSDRILASLALKMIATFEALVDDARARRGETMHHLKTLCEAFIYLYEAAASEERAHLVLAHALNQRLKYWRNNPGSIDADEIAALRAEIADLSQGQALPSKVKEVAERHPNLPGWYNRIYRLACEPAHISDLDDFFPDEHGRLPHGRTPYAAGRADVALRHGLRLMFGLGHFWNGTNRIGLVIDRADLEARFEGVLKGEA
jgi:hypothetical protein